MESHQMISCTFVCAMSNSDNIVRFSICYYNFTYKRTHYQKHTSIRLLKHIPIKYIYDTTINVQYQVTYIVYLFLQVRLLWHLLLHILPGLSINIESPDFTSLKTFASVGLTLFFTICTITSKKTRLSTYNNTDGVAPCKTPLGTDRDNKCVKTYQTVNRLNVLVNFAKD